MNFPSKLTLSTLAFCAVVAASTLPAHADEIITPGSYIGAGGSVSTSQLSADTGANITGRYKFDNMPASIRTTVLLGGGGTSIVPTVSYDLPLGDRTNVYLGAGASIPTNDNNTLLGNKTAFALQPGIEVSLNKQLLLYGNAIVSLNGLNGGNTTGTSIQGGIGYQF